MKRILAAILIALIWFPFPVLGGWNLRHEEGWHWYQDPKLEEKVQNQATPRHPEPAAEVEAHKREMENLKAEAILRPTESSVKAYVEKQVWATNQSDRFSEVWSAVMRYNPELDYSVKYPAEQFARHIYLDQQKIQTQDAIENLRQNYGLIFFFQNQCPYCHAMGSIVQELTTQYGIAVTAVSLDGGVLTDFPKALPDNGISSQMKVSQVPAIYAVNLSNDEWFPIATGAMSSAELETRILAIVQYNQSKLPEGSHASISP
jgi:conjugal transfer pilus assembly protein TraF